MLAIFPRNSESMDLWKQLKTCFTRDFLIVGGNAGFTNKTKQNKTAFFGYDRQQIYIKG